MLEQRREIDLHFWAPNDQAASDLAQALYDAGYMALHPSTKLAALNLGMCPVK